MSNAAETLEVEAFADRTQPDAVALINAYIAGWPYTRAVDAKLLAHWRDPAGGRCQCQHMLLAYRGSRPVAFCHGHRWGDSRHTIHMLAVAKGAADDAAALLGEVERRCRADGMEGIDSPNWSSNRFYGGYVLGCEPYHPHWALDGTNAYLRAGFWVGLDGVLLVRPLAGVDKLEIEPFPAGYECEPLTDRREFDAVAFGYHALCRGEKAAHCYARLYPNLRAPGNPNGGPVGQIGNVTTEEPHRGKGLARVMVKMCVRDLQRMGASEVLIGTGLDNFAALKAYENAGFRRRHHISMWTKAL